MEYEVWTKYKLYMYMGGDKVGINCLVLKRANCSLKLSLFSGKECKTH